MIKKEAHDKALDMYLKAKGKITNKAIATAVGATPLTVGRWQKSENWIAKLTPEKKTTEKVRKPHEVKGFRKKEVFDQAVKIYQESGGKISNVQLGKELNVTPTTIAKWKQRPEWGQVIEPVTEEMSVASETAAPRMKVNLNTIIAPQDLIALNDRLRSMLDREYLTTEDIEHLANAKLTLLEAAGVFMAMHKEE